MTRHEQRYKVMTILYIQKYNPKFAHTFLHSNTINMDTYGKTKNALDGKRFIKVILAIKIYKL